jgi:hypothetical protein
MTVKIKMQDWVRREFDDDRDAVVRQLTGMIFSCDQNGHLTLVPGDIGTLVAAVDLLQRAQARERVR